MTSHCGSLEVRADAWAEWDSATREWVLPSTFQFLGSEPPASSRSASAKF